MRLIASLLTLTVLTTGLGACATNRIVGGCPVLAAPPAAAVDALQGASNRAVDAWVVQLDRHYQKLEACRGA